MILEKHCKIALDDRNRKGFLFILSNEKMELTFTTEINNYTKEEWYLIKMIEFKNARGDENEIY